MTVIEATAPVTTPVERRRLMGKAYDLSGATSADEARALAGLEWEALHRPIYVDMPDDIGGGMSLAEKDRMVIRSDNGEMFGTVGREHKILTNGEMFDFADTLLTEAGLTWAEAAPFGGSLAGGKSPFLALRMPSDVMIGGVDQVGTTLLLSNGHSGNGSFVSIVTPERTGCSNIVRPTIRRGGKNLAFFTIQHSGDMAAKVATVREALTLSTAFMREFADLADRMAAVDFGLSEFSDFLTELVPVSDEAGDRAKATAENTRAIFRQNWRDTLTLTPDLKSTTWGALNVVTEIVDHGNLDVRRSAVPAHERRMNSVHFGAGARMRERAYSLLGA